MEMLCKKIVVQKYGGESIANFERMQRVAEYVAKTVCQGKRVVVVISAMGKTTDNLIEIARQVYGGEPPRDELDNLLVTGEQQSASLFALKMRSLGFDAVSLTGWQIGLETDGRGRIKRVQKIAIIEDLLDQGKIPIVAGFQGIIEGTDKLITLGRGGSDTTAVALAASLNSSGDCELYKDVDGVYTVDPDIVPNAIRFEKISYYQMGQLASAGAKVIMPRAVALAQNFGVKIKILLSPSIGVSCGGTLVYSGTTVEEMEKFWFRPAIAVKHVSLVKIMNVSNEPGKAACIFRPLKNVNLGDSVQGVGEKTADINIVCSRDDLNYILVQLEKVKKSGLLGEVKICDYPEMVQLTLVSPVMVEEPGYLARVVEALSEVKINIESLGSSGNSIWVAVKKENLKKAAQALAEEFELVEKLEEV
jgi:aspartate kinase